MILRPVKHGKKCAIILSDQMLAVPEESTDELALTIFKKVKRKYSRVFQRLADR